MDSTESIGISPLKWFLAKALVYAYLGFLKKGAEKRGGNLQRLDEHLVEATKLSLELAERELSRNPTQFDILHKWGLLRVESGYLVDSGSAMTATTSLQEGLSSIVNDEVPAFSFNETGVYYYRNAVGPPYPGGPKGGKDDDEKGKDKEDEGQKRMREEEGETSRPKRRRLEDLPEFEELNDILGDLPLEIWNTVLSSMGDWEDIADIFGLLRVTSKTGARVVKELIVTSVLRDQPTVLGRLPKLSKYIVTSAQDKVTHLQLSPFCVGNLYAPSLFAESLVKLEILDMDLHREREAEAVFDAYCDRRKEEEGPGVFKLIAPDFSFRIAPYLYNEAYKHIAKHVPYLEYYVRDRTRDDRWDHWLEIPGEKDYRQLFEREASLNNNDAGAVVYPNLKVLHIKGSAFVPKEWFSACRFPALETLILDETLTGRIGAEVQRYEVNRVDGGDYKVWISHPMRLLGQFDDECLSGMTSLKSLTMKGMKLLHGVTSKTWSAIGPTLKHLSLGPCASTKWDYEDYEGFYARELWHRSSFLQTHHMLYLTGLESLEVDGSRSSDSSTGAHADRYASDHDPDYSVWSDRLFFFVEDYFSEAASGKEVAPLPEAVLPVQMHDPVVSVLDGYAQYSTEITRGYSRTYGERDAYTPQQHVQTNGTYAPSVQDPRSKAFAHDNYSKQSALIHFVGKEPDAKAYCLKRLPLGYDRKGVNYGSPSRLPENESDREYVSPPEASTLQREITLEEAWTTVARAGNLRKLKFSGYFEMGLEGDRTPYSGFVRYLTGLEDLHLDFCLFLNSHFVTEWLTVHSSSFNRPLRGYLERYCNGVKAAVFQDVCKNLKKLKSLKLTHFDFHRDEAAIAAAAAPFEIDYHFLRRLEKLSLKSKFMDCIVVDANYGPRTPNEKVPGRLLTKHGLEWDMVNYFTMRFMDDVDEEHLHLAGEKALKSRDWTRELWANKGLELDVAFFRELITRSSGLRSISVQGCEFSGDYAADRFLAPSVLTRGNAPGRAMSLDLRKFKMVDCGTSKPSTMEDFDESLDHLVQDVLQLPYLDDLTLLGIYGLTDRAFIHDPKGELEKKRYFATEEDRLYMRREGHDDVLPTHKRHPEIYNVEPLENVRRLALSYGERVNPQVLKRFPNLKRLFLCPDMLPSPFTARLYDPRFIRWFPAQMRLRFAYEASTGEITGLRRTPFPVNVSKFFIWDLDVESNLVDMFDLEELELVKCISFLGNSLEGLYGLKSLKLHWCPNLLGDQLEGLPFLQTLEMDYSQLYYPDRVPHTYDRDGSPLDFNLLRYQTPSYANDVVVAAVIYQPNRPYVGNSAEMLDLTTKNRRDWDHLGGATRVILPAATNEMQRLKKMSINAFTSRYDDMCPYSFLGSPYAAIRHGNFASAFGHPTYEYRRAIAPRVMEAAMRIYTLGYDGFSGAPSLIYDLDERRYDF